MVMFLMRTVMVMGADKKQFMVLMWLLMIEINVMTLTMMTTIQHVSCVLVSVCACTPHTGVYMPFRTPR